MPPTSSHLPEDSNHANEEDFSGDYQTPPTHPDSSQPNYTQPVAYGAQSSYFPSTPASYPQSMTSRVMAPIPSYSYNYPSTIPGPSALQLPEGVHPPQSYIGAYGGPAPTSQRGDGYYYSQSSMPDASYIHQYMPFRQPQLGLQYPEVGPPPSPHPSTGSSTSQRPNSPDQRGSDHSRRIDEMRYGSMANNYRHIITTVSQASPSPSTDSSSHSFERPIVDDMLHRAVEGLRHLDPSRAEQYTYAYDPASEIPSGVVGEAPPETVFVQYYEDGRADVNPTKKKKRERKGATQCASCHATSTPEWRRGPLGPRTLCNACGLVYAKLMKKRAKEGDRLSVDPPRRARSGGRSRQATEESEDQGSDDALPPTAGPSTESGYPP